MKKQLIFLLFITGCIITSCQKEKSELASIPTITDAIKNTTGANETTITVSFSTTSIPIEEVDSVVVDLIGSAGTEYQHIKLGKKENQFTTGINAPEKAYTAYLIIYKHPASNNRYAYLASLPYTGISSIAETAPEGGLGNDKWNLMAHISNPANDFFALIGIAPSNPLLYLFTNANKSNYIYFDKVYTNNGQAVGSDSYEYYDNTILSHPIVIKDAFPNVGRSMNGKQWNGMNSMTIAMNDITGEETLFYIDYKR